MTCNQKNWKFWSNFSKLIFYKNKTVPNAIYSFWYIGWRFKIGHQIGQFYSAILFIRKHKLHWEQACYKIG